MAESEAPPPKTCVQPTKLRGLFANARRLGSLGSFPKPYTLNPFIMLEACPTVKQEAYACHSPAPRCCVYIVETAEISLIDSRRAAPTAEYKKRQILRTGLPRKPALNFVRVTLRWLQT